MREAFQQVSSSSSKHEFASFEVEPSWLKERLTSEGVGINRGKIIIK